jgi:hypothetical protein
MKARYRQAPGKFLDRGELFHQQPANFGEPVKVILRTSGLEVISPPISRESLVITFKTPEGIPARSASTASANADAA